MQTVGAAGLGSGVCAFTTLRDGGVSLGVYAHNNLGDHVGDDPDRVTRNRSRLNALLPTEPLWLNQVHGTAVVDADHPIEPATATADAAVTTAPNRVLAILTADCLPVVVVNEASTVLGMAHAGWRGLAAGVLRNLLDSIRQRCGQHERLHAWIGPCIGPTAFQVGSDVRSAFVALHQENHLFFKPDPHHAQKWLCDLPGLASAELRGSGVDSVMWCGDCTVTDEKQFFSYRRDGVTGRMATVAWLVRPGA